MRRINSVNSWKSPLVFSVASLAGLFFTGFFQLGLRRLRTFGSTGAELFMLQGYTDDTIMGLDIGTHIVDAQ